MLVSSGFLFVGLKTKAGAGQVKAWNMATNTEYLMEGHVVRTAVRPVGRTAALCTASRSACDSAGTCLRKWLSHLAMFA